MGNLMLEMIAMLWVNLIFQFLEFCACLIDDRMGVDMVENYFADTPAIEGSKLQDRNMMLG